MAIHVPQVGKDVFLDCRDIPRTADKMMAGMMNLFHPSAGKVLAPHLHRDLRTKAEFDRKIFPEEKAVFDRVRDWLIDRLEMLQLGDVDNGKLVLNPWNDTHDLGLQSVSVEVNRLVSADNRIRRVPLLLPGEWKSPTIGVIAKGLLSRRFSRVKGSLAEFGIDDGKSEKLTAMSDGFPVVVGNHGTLPIRANDSVTVRGPESAGVFIEKPGEPEAVEQKVKEAVYACAFMGRDRSVAS
ncbi:MAG: hypothetical protein Q8P62_00190 [Candidatus Peregrinibacteria bacterium]|nr:hypothetical protein [Candidatus Peregrinibacteria bacterium]